jgi:1-acyl-sn-glycerol-3-phosphate acyltransferase
MLLVFPFALVATFWGRIKGGNFIYRLCMLWGDIWFALIFIRHKNIYEEPLRKHQPYIFVANHISYLDAAIICKTIRQPVRALGKVEMAKTPLFGFIYKKVIVSVDRSSAENRAASVRLLKSILSKGISVFVFPEGTFNETNQPLKSFYDGAFRVAIETQTPIKPVLFLDAYDRLHYGSVFSLNPGQSRSVFLEEISVNHLTTKDIASLKQQVYELMDEKLRSYNASWIDVE